MPTGEGVRIEAHRLVTQGTFRIGIGGLPRSPSNLEVPSDQRERARGETLAAGPIDLTHPHCNKTRCCEH